MWLVSQSIRRLSLDRQVLLCRNLLVQIPPHTGFGSEEDTLRSLSFRPIKPKKKRMDALQGQSLRFKAELVSDDPNNEGRCFFITYFLEDESISVFEKQILNSGYTGGKYLERCRYCCGSSDRPHHTIQPSPAAHSLSLMSTG